MSYEYTDGGGRALHVHPYLPGPAMEIATPRGTVQVGPSEAPALALAILEAAGIVPGIGTHPDTTPEEFESAAAFYLRQSIGKRAEAQAREAEDAKVREFRTVALEADGVWLGSIAEWDLMGESKKDIWRARYRAAREFFTRDVDGTDCHAEAEPAPRVLHHGDPEPNRGTKWRDADGAVWSWESGDESSTGYPGWTNGGTDLHWEWECPIISRPLTEVTP